MPRDITEVAPIPADKRIAYGEDANQFFDVWRPKARKPEGAAIVVHGGFWRARYDLSHASHMCAALAHAGIATASLEYRRVGNYGGGWPGTFDDIVAGVKAASTFLHAAKTIVIGHSAGGHLALRIASEPLAISGVVALAPVANLRAAYELHLSNDAVAEFLGGTPESIPRVYDAACASTNRSTMRRTLVHGTADEVVPLNLSIRYMQAQSTDSSQVRLIAMADVDHFALIDPESSAWPFVMEVVNELLR